MSRNNNNNNNNRFRLNFSNNGSPLSNNRPLVNTSNSENVPVPNALRNNNQFRLNFSKNGGSPLPNNNSSSVNSIQSNFSNQSKNNLVANLKNNSNTLIGNVVPNNTPVIAPSIVPTSVENKLKSYLKNNFTNKTVVKINRRDNTNGFSKNNINKITFVNNKSQKPVEIYVNANVRNINKNFFKKPTNRFLNRQRSPMIYKQNGPFGAGYYSNKDFKLNKFNNVPGNAPNAPNLNVLPDPGNLNNNGNANVLPNPGNLNNNGNVNKNNKRPGFLNAGNGPKNNSPLGPLGSNVNKKLECQRLRALLADINKQLANKSC